MKSSSQSKTKSKIIIIAAGILAAAGVAIQFVPVEKTNPPVTAEISAPPEIHRIFKRSCYDCHSNETKWPWYSHIAPISWGLSKDVITGREYMNFSSWNSLSDSGKEYLKKQIWKELSADEMPLFVYKLGHPDARLSDSEKALIKKWSEN